MGKKSNTIPRKWGVVMSEDIEDTEATEAIQTIEDLTLLLIHLTSWKEKMGKEAFVLRAWKGYNFDAINKLTEKGYITSSYKAKSVNLTNEGVERAEKLRDLYLGGTKNTSSETAAKRNKSKPTPFFI